MTSKKWDIESIIDDAEPAESVVTLCIKGGLRSRYDLLEAELGAHAETAVASLAGSLGGDADKHRIAAEMADLEAQMRAWERTFTLRAVTPRRAWRNILAKRPVKTPGMDADEHADLYHSWVCRIVAATALDPTMDADQVERLADKLSDGDWQKLANTAYAVNDDSRDIPFSAAASALIRSSGVKSKPPATSDSPAPGSSAGNPEPSPSTNTGPTDS
jgi:hypothetical protein